ncbi:MAG: hypothetical protein AB4352_12665 [Hormoscilla sp.]
MPRPHARSPPETIAPRTTGVRRYISFGWEPNVIDAVHLPILLKMFNILCPNSTDDRPTTPDRLRPGRARE